MTSDQGPSSVFSAFSAVLGYIGAEAVTSHAFERLLWPQRNIAHWTWRDLPSLALLDPMGGPLYKASIAALDDFRAQGLLEGSHHGDMLGTAFFRNQPHTYTAPDVHDPNQMKTNPVRNFLWFRVVRLALRTMRKRFGLPIPIVEKGEGPEKIVRARTAVAHLTLRIAKANSAGARVSEASSDFSLAAISGVFVTEMTGIGVAAAVGGVWRSLWAFWWIIPLLLRLLSLVCQLPREPFIDTIDTPRQDEWDFEIDCGHSTTLLVLVTGPPTIVRHFLGHYGHPRRHRFRELVQILIIVAFGCLFPVGLLCAGLWMQDSIQYVWVSYQIYAVVAMYIARYTGAYELATTEARLADGLSTSLSGGQVVFGRQQKAVAASLEVTYHSRRIEGRDHLARLVKRRDGSQSRG